MAISLTDGNDLLNKKMKESMKFQPKQDTFENFREKAKNFSQDDLVQESIVEKNIFPLLNEMKVLTIFEGAIAKKYGDSLKNEDFRDTAKKLIEKLTDIETYIVAHHDLIGQPISKDREHWTRNKMRGQWAEAVAKAWELNDFVGVDNLKSRVTAIVALSNQMASTDAQYVKEPFSINHNTQVRLYTDKAVTKAIELKTLASIGHESIRGISEDILMLAREYHKHLTDDILQEHNDSALLMSMSVSKVINLYEKEFVKSYRNNVSEEEALRNKAVSFTKQEISVLSKVSKSIEVKMATNTDLGKFHV